MEITEFLDDGSVIIMNNLLMISRNMFASVLQYTIFMKVIKHNISPFFSLNYAVFLEPSMRDILST